MQRCVAAGVLPVCQGKSTAVQSFVRARLQSMTACPIVQLSGPGMRHKRMQHAHILSSIFSALLAACLLSVHHSKA